MTESIVPPLPTPSRGSAPPTTSPRGTIALMFDRRFGAFFWGKLISATGVWLHIMISIVMVYDLTGSTLLVAAVSAGHFLPQVLLSPLAGRFADSGRPGRQIALGRLLCASGSTYLAVWFAIDDGTSGTTTATHVIAASVLVGLGFVVGGPAQQSVLPTLIRPGELPPAMVLNSVPMTMGRVVGPALGALGTAYLGIVPAFTLAALTNVLFAAVAISLRLGRAHDAPDETDFSVRAGLHHVARDRPLLLLLVAITGAACGAEPSITLAPVLVDELEGGTQLVGIFTAAFGTGAMVGLLMTTTINRRITTSLSVGIGLWNMVAALAALSAAGTPWVAIAALSALGWGFTLATIGISTLIQERSPAHLRGRIMALWMLGFIGSRPLAAGLEGLIADALSVRAALITTTVLMAAAAIACRPGNLRSSV